MTVAEVSRFEEGAIWRLKQKAQFDYALANLIGISSARIMSTEVKFPTLYEAYPDYFEAELMKEAEEERAANETMNQFLEFANKHNAKKRKEGGEKT